MRLILAGLALLAGCASPPPAAPTEAGTAALLALNRQIVETQILDKDAAVFLAHSAEDFRVLAPGGRIENRDSAAAGVVAWDAQAVTLSGEEVVYHGDTAILMGRLDIDGTMAPIGRWGPLKYMAVFQRTEDGWVQLSRAVTPCLPKAVEMGFC